MEEFIKLINGLENLNNNNPLEVLKTVFDFPNMVKLKLLLGKINDGIKKNSSDEIDERILILVKGLQSITPNSEILTTGSVMDMFKHVSNISSVTSPAETDNSLLQVLSGESSYINEGVLEIQYSDTGVLQCCNIDTANDFVLNNKIKVNQFSEFTVMNSMLTKFINVLSHSEDKSKQFAALLYALHYKVLNKVRPLCEDGKTYTIIVNNEKLDIDKALCGIDYTKEIKQINDNEAVFSALIIYSNRREK